MDYKLFLTWILCCGPDDVDYLFASMDSDLLYKGIKFCRDNDIYMSAENLWTEIIGLAAVEVFGQQCDFIDTVFNCLDSRISIKKEYLQYIEGFEEKKDKFEKLVNDTLEIWEE